MEMHLSVVHLLLHDMRSHMIIYAVTFFSSIITFFAYIFLHMGFHYLNTTSLDVENGEEKWI